jgi:hypothetical protein
MARVSCARPRPAQTTPPRMPAVRIALLARSGERKVASNGAGQRRRKLRRTYRRINVQVRTQKEKEGGRHGQAAAGPRAAEGLLLSRAGRLRREESREGGSWLALAPAIITLCALQFGIQARTLEATEPPESQFRHRERFQSIISRALSLTRPLCPRCC